MSEAGDLIADRYRLQQRLGSGAMGVVWQAKDERLQRQVAIKQLLLQPGLGPEQGDQARQRAMREGRVAARLHHPHAISVYDVVVDDGLPVLVMEHLPSRSLAEALAEKGCLEPGTVARIGAESASALAAAHAAGVVHRDIKPGNILIAEDGTAKITDFGISHATGDVALTQTGLVAGTPAFLAPEVARGQQPTASSDIYSLAATLYAAVEGTPPFGAGEENPLALLHKVAAGDVPPPQQAGSLTPVLNSMLSADPEARPSALQVGDALHAVAAEDPLPTTVVDAAGQWHTRETTQLPGATGQVSTASHPAGTLTDAPPEPASGTGDTVPASSRVGEHSRSRRRRRLPLALALVAAAVLAGVVLSVLLIPDDEPPPTQAVSMAPAEREKAVAEYYALLPAEAEKAWNRLSPKLRDQGRQSYLNRWSAVSSVSIIAAPEAIGKNAVHVGIKLTMPDGTKITQFHRLGLVANENALLINKDKLVRSETSAPAAPPVRQTEDNAEDNQRSQEDRRNEQGNGDGRRTPDENPGASKTTEQPTTTQAPEEETTEEDDQPTETEQSAAPTS